MQWRAHLEPRDPALAARWAGLLTAIAAVVTTVHLIDAVRRHPLDLPDGTVLALSVSLGVGYVGTADQSLRDLYASADRSLYGAKHSGRDRVGTPVGDTA